MRLPDGAVVRALVSLQGGRLALEAGQGEPLGVWDLSELRLTFGADGVELEVEGDQLFLVLADLEGFTRAVEEAAPPRGRRRTRRPAEKAPGAASPPRERRGFWRGWGRRKREEEPAVTESAPSPSPVASPPKDVPRPDPPTPPQQDEPVPVRSSVGERLVSAASTAPRRDDPPRAEPAVEEPRSRPSGKGRRRSAPSRRSVLIGLLGLGLAGLGVVSTNLLVLVLMGAGGVLVLTGAMAASDPYIASRLPPAVSVVHLLLGGVGAILLSVAVVVVT